MSREIKAPPAAVQTSKSFDGKHEIAFNEGSHRYKWLCECHAKASAVGTTTFLKAGYPTSMGLVSWMKGQTAEALFRSITVPGEGGHMPREGFWPITDETKLQLIKDAKLADRDTAQEAADIGTVLHGFSELHSLGKVKESNALLDQVRGVAQWPLIDACVQKYIAWDAQNKGKLVLAEAIVASPTALYCGKIDRLDKTKIGLILRDYKTSKAIFTEQKMQLAMYRRAIREWLGLEVVGIEILRFGKTDGAFETELITDPKILEALEQQGFRCRETYAFVNEFDKRPS